MIGLIITGHGEFASGMMSAIKLLSGIPEECVAVDFTQQDTTDDLEFRLKDIIEGMNSCEGILVLTDLYGGSPFNEAIELSHELQDHQDIRVVSGVNLGMILQADRARGYVNNVDVLADLAIDEGKKQTFKYIDEEN